MIAYYDPTEPAQETAETSFEIPVGCQKSVFGLFYLKFRW